MREYEMETTFDVPARTFLRVVYGDDGFFFRRFHHETGECPDASVPAWNSGGMGDDAGSPSTRVVVFTKTMSLPSVIERLLGSGGAMAMKWVKRHFHNARDYVERSFGRHGGAHQEAGEGVRRCACVRAPAPRACPPPRRCSGAPRGCPCACWRRGPGKQARAQTWPSRTKGGWR